MAFSIEQLKLGKEKYAEFVRQHETSGSETFRTVLANIRANKAKMHPEASVGTKQYQSYPNESAEAKGKRYAPIPNEADTDWPPGFSRSHSLSLGCTF